METAARGQSNAVGARDLAALATGQVPRATTGRPWGNTSQSEAPRPDLYPALSGDPCGL